MSGIALGIVLASAFLHAGWNYLLKKSDRKIVFIWWFLLMSAIIYLPVFLLLSARSPIPPAGWLCIVATGIIHGVYFWCMGGAYQRGDLSLVYPLARGSGPLFVPILAVILLREEIALLGGDRDRSHHRRDLLHPSALLQPRRFPGAFPRPPGRGLPVGALHGAAIAFYSLVDKVGVGLVYPPVYIYIMLLITWLVITPWILIRERDWLMAEWRRRKGSIVVVGFLSGFTYLMILFALR